MIVIDMDMPKNCVKCHEKGIQEMLECRLIFSGCANCGRHPNCLIKCDIEDIKAEIEETIESYVCDKEENTMKAQGMLNAMRMMFEIIDKRISGKER